MIFTMPVVSLSNDLCCTTCYLFLKKNGAKENTSHVNLFRKMWNIRSNFTLF